MNGLTGCDRCGFGAEATFAQRHRLESLSNGLAYLFGTEVSFRSYQHQHIFTRRTGAGKQGIFLPPAMGHEFMSGKRLTHEGRKLPHPPADAGQNGLARLLHRRHKHSFQTGGIQLDAFGKAAAQKRNLIDAYLDGFLAKPFHSVHVLRRSYGYV
jgi:hypothetical protein